MKEALEGNGYLEIWCLRFGGSLVEDPMGGCQVLIGEVKENYRGEGQV